MRRRCQRAQARALPITPEALTEEAVAEVPVISGNMWHDAETAVLMREHGIRRICTRDTDFALFPWLGIVGPLTGSCMSTLRPSHANARTTVVFCIDVALVDVQRILDARGMKPDTNA